ncbi:Panacea domain-containing protein [Nonomuraea sp. NPDC003560]|uniref:Panacea domain-containing protein n=1 Tax=Nonomuraea sp. NPDC003560 TaxID=3364341 RepID=UPI0036744836
MSETRGNRQGLHQPRSDAYPEPMPVSARDVAAALRERHPGLGRVQVHKLLYFAQGHHLATFGRPLFSDTICAWDMGPVVPTLWHEEKTGEAWYQGVGEETYAPPLSEAELNTVGYVLSRYGRLSGKDLENLSHSQDPWLDANERRMPGGSVRIEVEAIREYFAAAEDADDEDGIRLDSDQVRAWMAGVEERRHIPRKPDDPEKLRAMLAAARGY